LEDSLKILIADDHSLVRDGLRIALTGLPVPPEIVEAADANEVRRAMADHPAIDLVILDLHMPGANELELLKSLCNAHPDIPVVVLSATENRHTMQRAIEHGAAGFIPKSCANSVLLSALQLVLSGAVYIPSEIFAHAANDETDAIRGSDDDGTGEWSKTITRDAFTGRQIDVLKLLASGHSNKVIARELCVSEHTVKIHLSAIFRILGVSNRTEAAIACRERGLFTSG
jgi:DNA-binding NarL/FixJ family response regulator